MCLNVSKLCTNCRLSVSRTRSVSAVFVIVIILFIRQALITSYRIQRRPIFLCFRCLTANVALRLTKFYYIHTYIIRIIVPSHT